MSRSSTRTANSRACRRSTAPSGSTSAELGKRLMCDHHHEEAVTMGLLADQHLKGAQNIYFRYGGPGL